MKYYVNKIAQNTGEHEVHTEDCSYLPSFNNREYLGDYSNCQSAVNRAIALGYSPADGCYHCSRACHRR